MIWVVWKPWSHHAVAGATGEEERETLDWKTLGNYVLLVGLFVAMVSMFNQASGRLDSMNERIDASNGRIDIVQAENQRQHDAMQEVLRVFEGRITRVEERAGVDPGTAE